MGRCKPAKHRNLLRYLPDRKETIIVSIHPNPLPGDGTVIIQSKNDLSLSAQVCDAMGRIVLAKELQLRGGLIHWSLTVIAGLPACILFLFDHPMETGL